jgi:hypothetical protein
LHLIKIIWIWIGYAPVFIILDVTTITMGELWISAAKKPKKE